MFRARQFVRPVTREELDGIVELWVDAALRLGERELKMMSRLARAQARRMENEQAPRPQDEVALLEPLAMAS
jgi:DSF synthase